MSGVVVREREGRSPRLSPNVAMWRSEHAYSPAKSRMSMYVVEPMNRTTRSKPKALALS